MNLYKEKKNNLIVLIAFAASFSLIIAVCLNIDERNEIISAANFSSAGLIAAVTEDVNQAIIDTYVDFPEVDEELMGLEEEQSEEAAADVSHTPFTVSEYGSSVTKYASATVNVRAGAGTDYDRVGKVSWGTPLPVTGETDNGWFQVSYKDMSAYIRGDYMVDQIPGTPFVFVGDSRTVQMQQAIGSSDKAYIAKVGEGYNYFRDVAIPAIPKYAGYGTTMIINFGVNDLRNASKYVKLVNNNIDSWAAAGIKVYYSAVTPVSSGTTVTNAQIENFNNILKEGLDSRITWIDSYTYLNQAGFSTPDGLHYSLDTYRSLYSYYLSVIE